MAEKEKDPRTEWPTRRKAAAMLGISVRTIDRMVVSGELRPITIDGVKRFDPVDVEAVDCENPNGDIQPILDTLNDTIKKTTDHTESFFRMVDEPARLLLGIFKDENQALRTENATLREKHLDTVESYEVLLSAKHERELASKEADARIKRGNEAFNLFMELAPDLVNQILAGNKLKKTVTNLDEETFTALTTADVLPPDAIEYLKTLRKNVTVPDKKAEQANGGAEPKSEAGTEQAG